LSSLCTPVLSVGELQVAVLGDRKLARRAVVFCARGPASAAVVEALRLADEPGPGSVRVFITGLPEGSQLCPSKAVAEAYRGAASAWWRHHRWCFSLPNRPVFLLFMALVLLWRWFVLLMRSVGRVVTFRPLDLPDGASREAVAAVQGIDPKLPGFPSRPRETDELVRALSFLSHCDKVRTLVLSFGPGPAMSVTLATPHPADSVRRAVLQSGLGAPVTALPCFEYEKHITESQEEIDAQLEGTIAGPKNTGDPRARFTFGDLLDRELSGADGGDGGDEWIHCEAIIGSCTLVDYLDAFRTDALNTNSKGLVNKLLLPADKDKRNKVINEMLKLISKFD
jgi:hypothetical protein